MDILFSHPNMPGQYKYLCRKLAENPEHRVVFMTKSKNVEIPGVTRLTYQAPRDPSPMTHRYITAVERAIIQGQECWRVARKLKEEEGFSPDVICSHPGWGDALYLKDLFPDAMLLNYFEFFYHSAGVDVDFDPEEPAELDDLARVRTKNITNLQNLDAMDWGISPTFFQHDLHPKVYHPYISVLHDGIDTHVAKPDPEHSITIKEGLRLGQKDKLITYIARNFEPYRGFKTFMRAAEKILKADKDCHILAIGADEVSYGKRPPEGTTYRQMLMKELSLDLSRIHFVGVQPYQKLIRILQASSAHIYLTYPFVLSWSSLLI